jgi:DNA repair protein RadC
MAREFRENRRVNRDEIDPGPRTLQDARAMSSVKIPDLPLHERPRERLMKHGSHVLSDAELIAILLRTGYTGTSAVDLARNLLQEFGGLDKVAERPVADLAKRKGVGNAKAVQLKAAFSLAQRLTAHRGYETYLHAPEEVAMLMREEFRLLDRESFRVLLLNTKNKLIKVHEVSVGSLNASIAHPREIFKEALIYSAASVILTHNHPSGDPSPSPEDIQTTRRLVEAGRALMIDVSDHVIVGKSSANRAKDYSSFRELGLI